jgi:pimeloyl-ACP methyl ester carboxylesterase
LRNAVVPTGHDEVPPNSSAQRGHRLNGASGIAPTTDRRAGLYWESVGRGAPLLLIMGLGLSGGAWWRTVPVLARRFRVITYDHRGVGRSPSLTHTYTTEAMADDAASVLDAAGVDEAHVYGFSLGGLVAQQMAIRHSARVSSLVLGATHPGRPHAAVPALDVMAFFLRRPRLESEEAIWASVEYNYSESCRRDHPELIAEDVAWRLGQPFAVQAYKAQLIAAMRHCCYGALDRVDVPTLVVHGTEDRVVPVRNAELLADEIPGAQSMILRGAGHLYPTEQPDVDRSICAFLDAVS